MPKSVLEAIKMGYWEFEPQNVETNLFDSTDAMPGTDAKLSIMAERLEQGLPLWHDKDRSEVDEPRLNVASNS